MENLLKKVQKRTPLTRLLRLFSHLVTALSALAFVYLAVTAAKESMISLIELCVTLGVPFVAVTLLRRRINAPRPYEVYAFYPLPPKNKRGLSFPSRHAHSAFAIGTALCFSSLTLGGVLLGLALLMCVARVLLGIHFIRDVLGGALTGAVSTLLGKIIFSVL